MPVPSQPPAQGMSLGRTAFDGGGETPDPQDRVVVRRLESDLGGVDGVTLAFVRGVPEEDTNEARAGPAPSSQGQAEVEQGLRHLAAPKASRTRAGPEGPGV